MRWICLTNQVQLFLLEVVETIEVTNEEEVNLFSLKIYNFNLIRLD